MAGCLEPVFPREGGGPLKTTMVVTGGPVAAVDLLLSGRAVSVASNGNTEVWDAQTGERVRTPHESRWKIIEGGPSFHELIVAACRVHLGGHRGFLAMDEEGRHTSSKEGAVYAMAKVGNHGIFLCTKHESAGHVRVAAAYYHTARATWRFSEAETQLAKKILTDASGRLAVTLSYEGAMQCWDVESLVSIWSRPTLRRVRSNGILRLASKTLPFPAVVAGDQLIVSSGTRILCRDFATGKDVRIWKSSAQADGLAYSAARDQLFASFPDATVRRFDIQSGTEEIVFSDVPTGMLKLSPDDTLMLSGRVSPAVLDLPTGERLTTLRGHCLPISGVVFTPDDHVITASRDETVRLWHLRAPEAARIPRHDKGVVGIAIAPDGKHAVTAAADDQIGIWDVDAPASARLVPSGARLALAVSGDSQTLIAGTKRAIELRAIPTGEIVRRIRTNGFVTQLAPLSDSQLIAATRNDGELLLLNRSSGRRIWSKQAHSGYVGGLRVSGDERHILTWGGSDDATIKVHHCVDGQLAVVFGPFNDTVEDAWFFDNGSKVLAVVGGWWDDFDSRLHILDIQNGHQTLLEDETPEGSVEFSCAAVTPDQQYAVVACNATEQTAANPLRLWNLLTLRRERYLPSFGSVRSVAVIGNTHAVAACTDHCVRLWDLRTGSLVGYHRGSSEMWSCAADDQVVIAGEQSGITHVLRLHL